MELCQLVQREVGSPVPEPMATGTSGLQGKGDVRSLTLQQIGEGVMRGGGGKRRESRKEEENERDKKRKPTKAGRSRWEEGVMEKEGSCLCLVESGIPWGKDRSSIHTGSL